MATLTTRKIGFYSVRLLLLPYPFSMGSRFHAGALEVQQVDNNNSRRLYSPVEIRSEL